MCTKLIEYKYKQLTTECESAAFPTNDLPVPHALTNPGCGDGGSLLAKNEAIHPDYIVTRSVGAPIFCANPLLWA